MDNKLSSTEQFKNQLNKFLKIDKKDIIKSLLDSNLTGRGGAGFPTGMKWTFVVKQKEIKSMLFVMQTKGTQALFQIDIY